MKLRMASPGDKLLTLEGGSMVSDNNTGMSSSSRTNQYSGSSEIVRFLKIILYLELILIIGWFGSIFLLEPIAIRNYHDTTSEPTRTYGISATELTAPPGVDDRTNFESNVTTNREKRSIDENKREECERNVTANRVEMDQLTKLYVPGDATDPRIVVLREECTRRMTNLTIRMLMIDLIRPTGSAGPTDEQWNTFAHDIKREIVQFTDEDHRRLVDATVPPTPEMTNHLRAAIESMVRNYKNCEMILSFGIPTTRPTISELLKKRDECENMPATLKESLRPLIVQLIPGNSSDPIIMELRENVGNTALLLTAFLVQAASQTEEDLSAYLTTLKRSILSKTDSEHREQIERSGPPKKEIIEEVYRHTKKFPNVVVNCEKVEMFIEKIREHVRSQ